MTAGPSSTALGATRLVKPGVASCVYNGAKLAEIKVQPPEARGWPGRRVSFAKWQAVLQRKSDAGKWRRVAATGFDDPFTRLGSSFKRLAPRQMFASSLPASGYLRIKVEVRWVASNGSALGRRSSMTQGYRGSATRGCASQKGSATAGKSPVWWGNLERTALNSDATRADTQPNLEPIVGDYDGDDKDDILWYSPDGAETLWWGAGRVFQKTRSAVLAPSGYKPLAGDFDGDGYDDIYWYRGGASNDFQWWGSGSRAFEVRSTSDASGAYDQIVAGDYNGDLYDDIYFYRHPDKTKACEYTGAQFYWYGKAERNDLATGSTSATSECYYKWFTGDFDGDNVDDQLQYGLAPNPRDFVTFQGQTPENVRFDQPYGFRPVVGDYDGDVRADIFWFSPSGRDSQWWGPAERAEFLSGHRTELQIDGDYYPVSGDFDGDRRDDILWYAK
jgi:hypothetical protein